MEKDIKAVIKNFKEIILVIGLEMKLDVLAAWLTKIIDRKK